MIISKSLPKLNLPGLQVNEKMLIKKKENMKKSNYNFLEIKDQ